MAMSFTAHPSRAPPFLPTKHQNKLLQNKASTVLCMSEQTSSSGDSSSLQIGSPVVIVEAPATLKTADSMPSLKLNSGQVKAGDVGRIVARKPKDVWAVRLKIGTYLLDGKHFRPLDID